MSHCAGAWWQRAGQRGQSTTEYLVVLVLLAVLVSVPIDGEISLAALWSAAVRDGYARFLFALAGLV